MHIRFFVVPPSLRGLLAGLLSVAAIATAPARPTIQSLIHVIRLIVESASFVNSCNGRATFACTDMSGIQPFKERRKTRYVDM